MSRPWNELRPIVINPNFSSAPIASVFIEQGMTRILCTASLEEEVPPFRLGRGGWLTAEYGMLPGSTPRRVKRPIGKQDGRQTEIQRLIGRALRAAFNLDKLGARTLTIDCDVLEADGGTRTASITGGYVAARLAVERLIARSEAGVPMPGGPVGRDALLSPVAAISVGIVRGALALDLDYPLDSKADVDMNVVTDAQKNLIEVQATGEGRAMSRAELDQLLDLAQGALETLFPLQADAVVRGLAARPK
jgi:ribonuclease PH